MTVYSSWGSLSAFGAGGRRREINVKRKNLRTTEVIAEPLPDRKLPKITVPRVSIHVQEKIMGVELRKVA